MSGSNTWNLHGAGQQDVRPACTLSQIGDDAESVVFATMATAT